MVKSNKNNEDLILISRVVSLEASGSSFAKKYPYL